MVRIVISSLYFLYNEVQLYINYYCVTILVANVSKFMQNILIVIIQHWSPTSQNPMNHVTHPIYFRSRLEKGWGTQNTNCWCTIQTHPHLLYETFEAKVDCKMAHSFLLIFTLIAAILTPTILQSTCPSCDCKVNKPPIIDQIITTKIARVLNGQPSKSSC